MYHKGICKPDNLFKPIAKNTLNFRGWRIKSTNVAKVGCPFWTYRLPPLNSEMGSVKQNFLLFSAKLIEYIFSELSLCSNPGAGPLPRIKISFFVFSTFIDELISTPKNITFLPVPPLRCEKNPCVSNPYADYLYLPISAFLVKPTAPNKELSRVG